MFIDGDYRSQLSLPTAEENKLEILTRQLEDAGGTDEVQTHPLTMCISSDNLIRRIRSIAFVPQRLRDKVIVMLSGALENVRLQGKAPRGTYCQQIRL
jgi:hypothetical protein